jgi:hypothetical protein
MFVRSLSQQEAGTLFKNVRVYTKARNEEDETMFCSSSQSFQTKTTFVHVLIIPFLLLFPLISKKTFPFLLVSSHFLWIDQKGRISIETCIDYSLA